MFLFCFSFIISKILCEKQTIEVKNFCDLSIPMQNAGDELEIIIPPKTLFFVSSTEGYSINTKFYPAYLTPNPMQRLVYFEFTDRINVISTLDNINFCFHILVLPKIPKTVDHIFISTNPGEQFRIHHLDKFNNNSPGDCLYNATFTNNHLIWLIGDNRTICEINTKIYEPFINIWNQYAGRLTYPCSFAFPFVDPTNESNIDFQTIYMSYENKLTLKSKSKLIHIEKVADLYYDYTSFFTMTCSPESENNYYTDYRAYVNISNLKDDKVITRGEEHYKKLQRFYIFDGITYLDFSIYNKYFNSRLGNIIIFPKITEMSSNILFNDNITFMFQNEKELEFKSGIDYVAETDIKAPILAISIDLSDDPDKYFILSTCPTETLIIGPSYQNDINYTNDKTYQYIMGSFQDIRTNITFEGEVTIAKIENTEITNITFNSSQTIDGCFIAYINKNAKCRFETTPIGELKEGYYDDSRTMFKNPINLEKNIFISPKYGEYYNTTVDFKNQSVTFENRNFQIVSTFNVVYVQNQKGWSAEILYPEVQQHKKFGPKYNITSFYFSQVPENRRIVIKFNKENDDENFELKIRTTSTERVNERAFSPFNCERLIVFNKLPSKFSINFRQSSKYRQINVNYGEKVCIFPAVSDIYYGKQSIDSSFYNAYGNLIFSHDEYENDIYCSNISSYYYYQSDTHPILYFKGFSYKRNIAFLSPPDDEYYEDYLLPDEPKFYIDTRIWETFGVHPLNKNQYDEIDEGDDGNGDEGEDDINNVEANLDYVSSYEVVNMAKITNYTIRVRDNAFIIIHSNANSEAEAFVHEYGKSRSFGKIKSDSADKVIYYGPYDGFIRVTKSANSAKSLRSSDDTFIYSYINLAKVKSLDYQECYDILISSDPKVHFSIAGSELKDSSKYNHTLANSDNFCLWFPFPIKTKVSSNSNLPHSQSIVVDHEQEQLSDAENSYSGKNFLYMLKKSSSQTNDKSATYNAEPYISSDMSSVSSFYKINKIFKLNGKYGILSDEFVPKVVDKDTKKNDDFNFVIFIYIGTGVFVLIIIIVVVVVCVKKNKKHKVEANSEKP
ncbi:hypothetical protein M9Y10_023837 [Tritrichomonas musculus]|uniref:Uncharacterized protein n=1 Tax=Tritrichomonas musculus TaxID=1915356 RepID=A0ABR2KW84_9EUKA